MHLYRRLELQLLSNNHVSARSGTKSTPVGVSVQSWQFTSNPPLTMASCTSLQQSCRIHATKLAALCALCFFFYDGVFFFCLQLNLYTKKKQKNTQIIIKKADMFLVYIYGRQNNRLFFYPNLGNLDCCSTSIQALVYMKNSINIF